jgi:CheY-like chemotaxis protein
MPYLEWKVLFVISEDTVIGNIVDLVDDEEKEIQSALDGLLEKGLIEVTESAGEEPEQEETVEPSAKAAAVEETPPEEMPAEEAETEEAETIDLPEEESEEISLPEVEEESEEKTRIEVSAVEDETEVAEKETEEEAEADDKTDLSGLFDETEPETVTEAEQETPEPEPAEPAAGAEEVQTVTGKKIMVIDDSIVIRKMIEIALEEENYHLINASSGKEGMDSFEKDQPDLVILDMMLPDMSGIDLLKKIKEKSDTPIIMLSGKDSPQLVENAKEVGVNDFLPKPFKDEELVEKVKNLIN